MIVVNVNAHDGKAIQQGIWLAKHNIIVNDDIMVKYHTEKVNDKKYEFFGRYFFPEDKSNIATLFKLAWGGL